MTRPTNVELKKIYDAAYVDPKSFFTADGFDNGFEEIQGIFRF